MKLPQLFKKKELIIPTVAGWVLLLLLLFVLCVPAVFFLHSFLAPNNSCGGKFLIAEGWMPDYCFEEVAERMKQGAYIRVYVTGGPLEEGSFLQEYRTSAELGSATLVALSVPEFKVIAVPAPFSPIDRTWESAKTLKHWLDSAGIRDGSFDLCSQSTHTRRSHLLFKRALGSRYQVGSIAIVDREYDPRFWWRTSKGVRNVISELISYVYALFFITTAARGR